MRFFWKQCKSKNNIYTKLFKLSNNNNIRMNVLDFVVLLYQLLCVDVRWYSLYINIIISRFKFVCCCCWTADNQLYIYILN